MTGSPAAGRRPVPAVAAASPAGAAPVDLLVIGGGINGVGIARDAAGRGLSVLLCEKDDLAQATSSASTKLIHGGLRYLEHHAFGLVRKSLAEREGLLRAAPHLIRPMRFVLPHLPGMRPRWVIRAGLFLYDNLARRQWLPGTETVDLRRHETGAPLQPGFRTGFLYSDAWADDARLVVACAQDAAAHGAEVAVRTACIGARREGDAWTVTLREAGGASGASGGTRTVRARAVVNAAGPWAERVLREAVRGAGSRRLRLVKGSHIVVPRRFDHPYAYLFQGDAGRIIFSIPYERDFTLVGTTEVDHRADPGEAAIGADEVAYLCSLVNRYFRTPTAPKDVVWTFSGVRPLMDDGSGSATAVTRDYALDLEAGGPPLLTVWGGKLTTFRRLAEEAVDQVVRALGRSAAPWTEGASLPGGDLSAHVARTHRPDLDFDRFEAALRQRLPGLPPALLHRLARQYGSRIDHALGGGRRLSDLGAAVAPGVYEAELDHLARHEWARSGDDVLWRRTKLGLHLTLAERAAVADWMARHATGGAPVRAVRA